MGRAVTGTGDFEKTGMGMGKAKAKNGDGKMSKNRGTGKFFQNFAPKMLGNILRSLYNVQYIRHRNPFYSLKNFFGNPAVVHLQDLWFIADKLLYHRPRNDFLLGSTI